MGNKWVKKLAGETLLYACVYMCLYVQCLTFGGVEKAFIL